MSVLDEDEHRRLLVARALAEDVGTGDLTAALVPAQRLAYATVISRDEAILCGRDWFDEVFRQIDPAVTVDWEVADCAEIHTDQTLCRLEGPAGAILTGERTALNLLQTLSGTATTARRYLRAVEGLPVTLLDTRKTLPGLRAAQKYAVRCGGCRNHRMGLYDGILIKENHIQAAGTISQALAWARDRHPDMPIEVETESLEEFREALGAGADTIMLDNFPLDQVRTAVQEAKGRARLEASGGIGLEGLRTLAETGVDFISIGDLTKNLYAVDLSMRIGFCR